MRLGPIQREILAGINLSPGQRLQLHRLPYLVESARGREPESVEAAVERLKVRGIIRRAGSGYERTLRPARGSTP